MIGVRGLALIVLLGAVFSEPETYKGHKLYRAFPKSQSDVDYLDKLLKQGDDGFDFWSYPARSLDPVDIHADPASTQKLEDLLDGAEINFKIDTEDLAPLIEAEKAAPRAGGFDSKYHRLGENKRIARVHSVPDFASCEQIFHQNCDVNQIEELMQFSFSTIFTKF
ncbi:PREDICTED: uncharacterized protein LOC107330868, partial [Acropora digitifera]|uniref:uncharacterized protein LOC107330868 n=1 Tax=Acropora digitifera TaxID=70779 RepID=UPI00077A9B24